MIAIFANLPIGIPYSASFRVSKFYVTTLLDCRHWHEIAIPSYPSQITRCRRSRCRPTHRSRSRIPWLHTRKGILLHISNSLLRHPTHLRLQSSLHEHPFRKHRRSSNIRHPTRQIRILQLSPLPNLLLLPSRKSPSLRRPLYRRTLHFRKSTFLSQRPKNQHTRPGNVLLLRSPQFLHL